MLGMGADWPHVCMWRTLLYL